MRQIQDKCVEYDPDRKVLLLSYRSLRFKRPFKISIILEFIAGRVTTTLDRLIALYRPDSVVVGTRGQRRVLGFGAGRPGGVFSGKSDLVFRRFFSQGSPFCRRGFRIKVRTLPQSRTNYRRQARKKSKKGSRKEAKGSKARNSFRERVRPLSLFSRDSACQVSGYPEIVVCIILALTNTCRLTLTKTEDIGALPITPAISPSATKNG